MDIFSVLFSVLFLCFCSESFERYSEFASDTGKISLISALDILVKSCRFCS